MNMKLRSQYYVITPFPLDIPTKSIIAIFNKLFAISQKKEIDKLLVKRIFELIFNNSKEIDN